MSNVSAMWSQCSGLMCSHCSLDRRRRHVCRFHRSINLAYIFSTNMTRHFSSDAVRPFRADAVGEKKNKNKKNPLILGNQFASLPQLGKSLTTADWNFWYGSSWSGHDRSLLPPTLHDKQRLAKLQFGPTLKLSHAAKKRAQNRTVYIWLKLSRVMPPCGSGKSDHIIDMQRQVWLNPIMKAAFQLGSGRRSIQILYLRQKLIRILHTTLCQCFATVRVFWLTLLQHSYESSILLL